MEIRRSPAGRAVLAAFVWATIAGPALHLIDHRDDHVHEAGGAVRHLPHHAHAHGDGRWHTHDGPRAAEVSRADISRVGLPSDSELPGGGEHGLGAADHFALVFLDAAPVAVAVASDGPAAKAAVPAGEIPRPLALRSHRSRGPPPPPRS
jgi:hypothetical protein